MESHHKGTEGPQSATKARSKDWTASIIGCALRVHSNLGAGLLESLYEECLCREMSRYGLDFERQVAVPIQYQGELLAPTFRVDLIVQDQVIVEVKAVEKLLPVHEAQLLSYLKLSGRPLGLLLNFNVPHLRHGIRRKIFSPPPPTQRQPMP